MRNYLKVKKEIDIYKKGDFIKINRDFLEDIKIQISGIKKIQEKYKKFDNDSLFNEFKDSIIADYLGFELINIQKHGFDAKKNDQDEWLEAKQASFWSKSWSATFNDTTLEKAQSFIDEKVTLAVGVWDGLADLVFIVYGKNKKIGEFLKQKVKSFEKGNGKRSTQTISVDSLLKKYDFNLIPVQSYEEINNKLNKWYNEKKGKKSNEKKEWWISKFK